MKTSIEYGLTHPEVKDNLREYIINLGAQLAKKSNQKKINKISVKFHLLEGNFTLIFLKKRA